MAVCTGFTTLGTYATTGALEVQSTLKLTDSSDEVLWGITGVNVIQVTFKYSDVNYGDNNAAVYQEFDVAGVATSVPEPAAMAFLVVSVALLMRLGRARQHADSI